jgi:hypothetical protein
MSAAAETPSTRFSDTHERLDTNVETAGRSARQECLRHII